MIQSPSIAIGQFFKNVDKVPGWAPLYITVLVALETSSLPPAVWVRGLEVELPGVLLATILTYVIYQLGDSLDELVYKVRRGQRTYTRPRYLLGYRDARREAQRKLGQISGIYELSLALVNAAEKDRSPWFVHALNESAKYLRSIAVIAFLGGLLALTYKEFELALVVLATGAVCLAAYPWLKVCHARRLYKAAADLAKPPLNRALAVTALGGVRAVFWKGRLVNVTAA